MRIAIVTPAPARSRVGNRVTALRWAGHLRALGHRVRVLQAWSGEPCDLLVALHATKSHPSVVRWRDARGAAPLVVACGGTDVDVDLPGGVPETRTSLEAADAVVVLQPRAVDALPAAVRPRARAILQSARAPAGVTPWRPGDAPRALVLAHLREVKDPFLAAEAVRLLPPESRIVVEHAGAARAADMELRAREHAAATARWRWVGPLPHGAARRELARSWVLVVPSRSEGGANVVAEAVVCAVPVIATRVAGTVGQLGEDHPGWFPPGDAPALAALLLRCERDPEFRRELVAAGARVAARFAPEREREAWRELLRDLAA